MVEGGAPDLEWGCHELRGRSLGVGDTGLDPRGVLGASAVEGGRGERNTTIH